ncbi:hypothetical protein [Nocardia amamiensis]|uniref:hypothetical protein n=1 Tax=Nocardia amamiensis TaxID=404578 RepID=UPI0012F4FA67|nr:hypothetical protein [Nocardia amamiensis]
MLDVLGVAIGIAAAATVVPYLAGLAMVFAFGPLPALWPLIIVAYCGLALLPRLLILSRAMRRTSRGALCIEGAFAFSPQMGWLRCGYSSSCSVRF